CVQGHNGGCHSRREAFGVQRCSAPDSQLTHTPSHWFSPRLIAPYTSGCLASTSRVATLPRSDMPRFTNDTSTALRHGARTAKGLARPWRATSSACMITDVRMLDSRTSSQTLKSLHSMLPNSPAPHRHSMTMRTRIGKGH
ncbi:hypothetical protein JB92DRAFT_2934666, partial [Gautieria morchelliformis]